MADSPTRAAVTALKLTSFRNYASLSLTLDGRSVVLTGPNGAGKTNLLEAISFLSPGRGLRRAALEEVALHARRRRRGRSPQRVDNAAGAVDLGTGVALGAEGPETRRAVRVNHAPARSADALLEHLRVIWLTPAMDGLFTGPAAERRRFLDRAVLAIDKRHGTRVNAFEKAMRGRNKLLAETAPTRMRAGSTPSRRRWRSLASPSPRRGANGRASSPRSSPRAATDSPFPCAEIALEGTLEHELDGHAAERGRGSLPDGPRRRAAARCRRRPHPRRPAPLRPSRPPRAEAGGGRDLLDRRAEGAAHRPRPRAGAARRRSSPARRR